MPETWIFTAVLDTATIIDTYPSPSQDPDQPTAIDRSLGFLIGPPAEALAGQGTPRITIPRTGSSSSMGITWRTISISGVPSQTAFLYDIAHLGPRFIAMGCSENNVTVVVPVLADQRVAQPPQYIPTTIVDYVLGSTTAVMPEMPFDLRFAIADADPTTGAGTTRGFFQWNCELVFG
jgi:hypothetical protein